MCPRITAHVAFFFAMARLHMTYYNDNHNINGNIASQQVLRPQACRPRRAGEAAEDGQDAAPPGAPVPPGGACGQRAADHEGTAEGRAHHHARLPLRPKGKRSWANERRWLKFERTSHGRNTLFTRRFFRIDLCFEVKSGALLMMQVGANMRSSDVLGVPRCRGPNNTVPPTRAGSKRSTSPPRRRRPSTGLHILHVQNVIFLIEATLSSGLGVLKDSVPATPNKHLTSFCVVRVAFVPDRVRCTTLRYWSRSPPCLATCRE